MSKKKLRKNIEHICGFCNGEYSVETCCTFSDWTYDEEGKEWVSWQGFIERTKCCKRLLGEGYGNVNYFKTEQEAKQDSDKWKEKIGVWF